MTKIIKLLALDWVLKMRQKKFQKFIAKNKSSTSIV